jgi:hypothetical protein
MLRRLALVCALMPLVLAGCQCGRPQVTMAQASLLVPVDALEFGPVAEATTKALTFRVVNDGRATVPLSVTILPGGSPDFSLVQAPTSVEAGNLVQVPVLFTPTGSGEDTAVAEVSSPSLGEAPLHVTLHGGPISPALTFSPDPLDFHPTISSPTMKMVQLQSTGLAALTVSQVAVSASNPDFSVTALTSPSRILPGQSLGIAVTYTRTGKMAEGQLLVTSDAPSDAGVHTLRLLPDPPAACSNGLDDDGDGLVDFPDDPGCTDPMDLDEADSPMCTAGTTAPCGASDGGFCSGIRSCVSTNVWGHCGAHAPSAETCNDLDDDCDGVIDNGVTQPCYTGSPSTRGIGACHDGVNTCDAGVFGTLCFSEVLPAPHEVCGNRVDDDCNGQVDDGCSTDGGACNPAGTFTLDAGVLNYACCDFGFGATVSLNISSFTIGAGAMTVTPAPLQPSNTLNVAAPPATCPAGSFSYSRVNSGGCTETYTLAGTFVGPNTFVGTYSASFTGSQCTTSLCAGDPCVNQSWPISAGR